MDWGLLIPLCAIVIGPIAWVTTTWIRASHGYPIREGKALLHPGNPTAGRHMELLSKENEALKGQVLRLEERIAVLERIATDPAERTARQIEQLR